MSPRRPRVLSALTLCLALAGGSLGCAQTQRPDGGSGLLSARDRAPEFAAADQTGQLRRLSEFRGHPVVLYFYPRDATPGCTREACAFRDVWARLQSTGAVVLGVSTDDVASHARFAQQHSLPFPLLADTSGALVRSYGVGSILGMASRVTFLIAPDGSIARVWPHVDPGVHADEVLAAIAALAPAAATH